MAKSVSPVACHKGHACCCAALEKLACAAAAIHDQHCDCTEVGDAAGCKCCTESLSHVLDAMQSHIDCLRGTCTPVV